MLPKSRLVNYVVFVALFNGFLHTATSARTRGNNGNPQRTVPNGPRRGNNDKTPKIMQNAGSSTSISEDTDSCSLSHSYDAGCNTCRNGGICYTRIASRGTGPPFCCECRPGYYGNMCQKKYQCPADSAYKIRILDHNDHRSDGVFVKWEYPITPKGNTHGSGTLFPIGSTQVNVTYRVDEHNDVICTFKVSVFTKVTCPAIANTTTNGTRVSWLVIEVRQEEGHVLVESIERCPVNSENRHLPLAVRECNYNDVGGQWASNFTLNDCGMYQRAGLEDLPKIPLTPENVGDVADALANIIEDLNRNTEKLSITDVQKTIENIVDIRSPSPNVTNDVTRAVNAILSANTSSVNQETSRASSKIVQSFEKQVSYTIEQHGIFSSVKPNVAVEGVTVDEAQVTGGIGFAVSQTDEGFGAGGSFDPEEMAAGAQNVGISIQLPRDALFKNNNDTDARVSFIGYNDAKLFQSQEVDESAFMVVGPILSATVFGRQVANLSDPVIVQIKPNQVHESVLNSSKCVYWDFSMRDGIGDWAEDGCELISADSGKITCQCNHLTNFAVLVDFSGQHGQNSGSLNYALDVISKAGCAFSIVGLCLTLMIFLCCRGLRLSLQRKILIQFCISMLGLYFVFLIGIDSTHSNVGCIIVAALLHYFVVTTVLWMGVEARHMYITLVSESERVSRKFLIKAGIFVWGFGMIPVIVVLAVKQRHYLAASYCFLAPDSGLFFGLLLPIGLVLLHNTITFALVARKLLRSRSYVLKSDLENHEGEDGDGEDSHKSGRSDISQRLLNAFAVSILLGVTWVFGFLAIEQAEMVFQLLFCICNSFQGLLIFILFCYAQKDVRKMIFVKCFSEPPSDAVVKKVKKPAVTGATSVSSDTRVTGQSYTEDNDTLVTSVDGMTMTALESEEIVNSEVINEDNPVKASNQKSTGTGVNDRTGVTMVTNKNKLKQKQKSLQEPETEQTILSKTSSYSVA